MPVLQDLRKTKKVQLDTISGGEVEIYTSFLVKDIEDNQTKEGTEMMKTLLSIIKDWNLTDEQGNKLPITPENLGKLDIIDLMKIQNDKDLKSFLEKVQKMSVGKETK